MKNMRNPRRYVRRGDFITMILDEAKEVCKNSCICCSDLFYQITRNKLSSKKTFNFVNFARLKLNGVFYSSFYLIFTRKRKELVRNIKNKSKFRVQCYRIQQSIVLRPNCDVDAKISMTKSQSKLDYYLTTAILSRYF